MDDSRQPRADPAHHAFRLMTVVAWTGGGAFVASLGYFLYSFLQRFDSAPAGGPIVAPIAADVLLFSVFALHHSAFARTPFKAWVRSLVPAPLERSVYTWVASVLFVVVCWAWVPVPGVMYRIHNPFRILAYAMQGAGLLLTFLGSRALDVLDLAGVRPVLRARAGLSSPHVPLSTAGVFGIVRHPLYFGWALLVGAAPDMTATRAVFALVSCAYLAVAIWWEERALVETFGVEYETYRRSVRWRMIPFIY
jgi:protein-S-isoprenylcysteine O-methyltransferase Ste14